MSRTDCACAVSVRPPQRSATAAAPVVSLRPRRAGLTCLITWVAAVAAYSGPPHYLATRDIVLEYQAGHGAAVTAAELWVSTDSRRTWALVPGAAAGEHTLRYTAPASGTFDFCVVLKNDGGASCPPPAAGTAPTTTVVVDTLPPLLQIHGIHVLASTDTDEVAATSQPARGAPPSTESTPPSSETTEVVRPPTIQLDLTLVEEHLSELGLRAFYRTGAGGWQDGGPVRLTGDGARWTPPPGLRGSLDLRLVATDLAGNRATDQVDGIELPALNPHAGDARQPAPIVADQPATRPADRAPSLSAPEPRAVTEAQHLRDLATHHMEAGQFSLALARYEDALAVVPGDAELLADLGQTLFRLGRYDDADARFRAALDAVPDQRRALDGLALVAATQKRYPQAREYLLRLQQLQPNAGTVWLRSGDIEQRLGSRTQALADWKRALAQAGTDRELRDKAQRRLEYFDTQRTENAAGAVAKPPWPKPLNLLPSSSSAGTKNTRNPSP